MKCPKCDYLGFETGDRCRNCGYDFSLLAAAEPASPDLSLLPPEPSAPEPPPLPLFARAEGDDEPLIKLPAAPRPPLAVRRTPEPARPRAVAKTPRPVRPHAERREERIPAEPELDLQFAPEEPNDPPPRAPVRSTWRSCTSRCEWRR
jgi:hypothetical protein